ncbi:TAXI family TRAP transporter solute-binding subunit [Marinivivus vitaminiproducens]|uniref:TAXI family TRAP transporter solute-binding subunit n=1 Tax=Marinivivus vitaminiproducens TaxID=3035935 RepID=UPI0027A42984|nr:TAXI family TRAP transporter solute-binding subunit [Geminicoccaceae bacterium SCSIO 64248]
MKRYQAAMVATLLSATVAAPAAAETIELVAGQLGGGWYTMSTGMANILQREVPGLTVKVVPGGGTANPSKIQQGQSQLGTGLDIFAKMAREGTNIYEGAPHDKLMMIGQSFSDNYLHVIKSPDSDLSFEDIFTSEDLRLGVTKAGSSDEMTFRFVMEHFGTSYEGLRDNGYTIVQGDYNELASAYKDQQVDYIFIVLGIPGAAVLDMETGRPGELLAWPDELRQAMQTTYGYSLNEFPANTYPEYQKGPVATIVMATTLMVSSDVSEETAYNITKALCENTDELPDVHASMSVFNCETATENAPVPVHPGALKYYQEMGYL